MTWMRAAAAAAIVWCTAALGCTARPPEGAAPPLRDLSTRAEADGGAAGRVLPCGFVTGAFTTRHAAGAGAGATYVAYVPATFDAHAAPLPVVVGLHGCGDSAAHFADWALAPPETRATQRHIAVSVDGASARHACWDVRKDAPLVLAALDDIAQCLPVDRARVAIAGYSSGGMLAYAVALAHADRFAGALIECSALHRAGPIDKLLRAAGRKLPIAHRAHEADRVFPIAGVRRDCARLQRAGFPIELTIVPGDHQGSTADWIEALLPHLSTWRAP
jgi:predicted esterase